MEQEQRQIKYLDQEQVKALFKKIDDKRDKALFSLIYYYGLRVSEATLLRPQDVFWDRNRIFIHRVKGGIPGEKPLIGNAKRLLNAYLKERKDNGLALFTGRRGNLKECMIRKLFYKYAKKAKLDGYSIHSLRHSIAVHLLEMGQDVRYVQDHLGHKDIRSTQIYTTITDRKRDQAFQEMEMSERIVKV